MFQLTYSRIVRFGEGGGVFSGTDCVTEGISFGGWNGWMLHGLIDTVEFDCIGNCVKKREQ